MNSQQIDVIAKKYKNFLTHEIKKQSEPKNVISDDVLRQQISNGCVTLSDNVVFCCNCCMKCRIDINKTHGNSRCLYCLSKLTIQ